MQEASLEEGPVLRLILDYFERAGHAECLVSLENYCRENVDEDVLKSGSFPLELAALRELSLHGKWEQVVQYLNAFGGCSDKEGLERCLYLAERQKYFEILHHLESNIRSKFRLGYNLPGNEELLSSKEVDRTQNLIQHQLSVLESLSPSQEEFLLLNKLFSSSLSSSTEFSTWDLYSGRLETFYRIGEWVSKVLYLTVSFPKKSDREHNLAYEDSCSLLRLVAKGLLYEQCEKLCRLRCGEKEASDNSPKLLDLSSWIQQQPDSSFQSTPAEIVLVVKPLKSQQHCKGKCHDEHENELINSEQKLSVGGDLTQEVNNNVISKITETEKCLGRPAANLSVKEGEQVKLHAIPHSSRASSPTVQSHSTNDDLTMCRKRNSSTPRNYTAPEVSLQTSLPPSPIVPAASTSEEHKNHLPHAVANSDQSAQSVLLDMDVSGHLANKPPRHAGAYNYSQNLPHPPHKQNVQVTHMQEPQPTLGEGMVEKQKNLLSVDVNGGRVEQQVNSKPLDASKTKFRHSSKHKATKFKEATRGWSEYKPSMCDVTSSSLPAHATLLGTVSDKQVVRAVSFSESGNIVAVGANSRTLRLCHTHPLLDQYRDPSELDAFYLSPQYHKSSIYCLAWFHDSILASGSNDQSIRLLTCTQEHKIGTNTPLEIHKGTIRDLAFTPDGLLVSGGGRLPEVLVTDIQNSQNISSLTGGHVDQILAVGVLSRDLIMSGGLDGTMCAWDLRSRDVVSCTHLGSGVTSLSPCGREGLVAAHVDGSCSLFDLRSQQCSTTYTAHRGECRSVRTHPHQEWVLSGSYDGTVCLADVASAMADATERVRWNELCRHSDKVIQCRWHPGGQLFASTGTDRKACFWCI